MVAEVCLWAVLIILPSVKRAQEPPRSCIWALERGRDAGKHRDTTQTNGEAGGAGREREFTCHCRNHTARRADRLHKPLNHAFLVFHPPRSIPPALDAVPGGLSAARQSRAAATGGRLPRRLRGLSFGSFVVFLAVAFCVD